jgi:hypothetical protein
MKKLLSIAALLCVPALAQANLVVDGSFESYSTVTPGTWSIFGSGYGWTTGSNGVEIRNGIAGTAADGARFAELDTTANSWISQIIQTNANQSLELSFAYAPRAGVAANSSGIEVFWNNLSLGIITGDGNSGTSWLDHVYDVQADANGFGVLKFVATGVSDSFGGSLDKISVTAVVPEPASLALLSLGLGALAASRRRKQG